MNFVCPTCHVCGKQATVQVTPKQYMDWQMGEHIQDVFPDKSPDERELMISGTHPECWEKLFGGPEE